MSGFFAFLFSLRRCIKFQTKRRSRKLQLSKQEVRTDGYCSPHHETLVKLSVGSGIEDMVSSPVRPIITVHFENPTGRLAESPSPAR